MPNFDFHNNLSPEEFESFVRDVLEIRDNTLKFRTYRKGKDGGIDFKSTNSAEKIIGQTKLYQDNYNQLKATLIKEIIKVKRLNPDRYILATSVSLSPSQTQEILTLFKGYILSEEDILDKEQLNKYLGQEQYKYLLKTYSKLLVPDINFLESFLEDTVNRDIKNRTRREFDEIENNRKVFVQTDAFKESLEFLLKNKVIIISGNPGVGKTTLAHMISSYILFSEENKIDFIKVTNLNEIDRTFNIERKQVFFWDDFWGQNFAEAPNETNYYRQFNQTLNDFAHSENHYLIITSREYIIQTVCSKQSREFAFRLNLNKFILKVADLTEEERVRIFLNHLFFADFEKEYFYRLKYRDETLESIIHHPNYSPRHIGYFINKICTKDFISQNEIDDYSFFHYLRKYLNNPYFFWEEIFAKQTATAQLILIILLISSDPMSIKDLKQSFLSIQSLVRDSLNINIQPLDFDDEINALEELFIKTEFIWYLNDILIYFQSPGIKDYLLEYLRAKIDFYGESLIVGAIFLNQLNFVFTTQADVDVNDENLDTAIYGKKILLNEPLQKKLKGKLLSEFSVLNFSLSRDLYGEISYPESTKDSKYWKLVLLNRFFNVHLEENSDVRQFIIQKLLEDINGYKNGDGKIVSETSGYEFVSVVNICKSYVPFDKNKLLDDYHNSITFTHEFLAFYEFKEVFPKEFEDYLSKNLLSIRQEIKRTILWDIEWYLCDDMQDDFANLVDSEIGEVFDKYGLRMTKSFQRAMNEISEGDISTSRFDKKKKPKRKLPKYTPKKVKPNSKQKPPKFSRIIEEYIGNDDSANFNYKAYLKELGLDSSKNKKLLAFKKENELIDDYFEDEISVSVLADYLKSNEVNFISSSHFYDRIENHTLQAIAGKLKIDNINKLAFFFQQLAFEIFTQESFLTRKTITSKNISELFNILFQNKKLDVSLLYPLIVKRNNWYEFLNTGLLNYFVSTKLICEPDNEEYLKCLETVINCDFENNIKIFDLIKSVTPDRLEKQFFEPSVKEFQDSIKGSSSREIITKFFEFFEIKFEFEWNKKRKTFDEGLFNCSTKVIGFLLENLKESFDLIHLNFYFLKDYYDEENIEEFSINPLAYNVLYERVIKTCRIEKKTRFQNNEEYGCVTVNLSKFAENDENYVALKNIGMEKYILEIIDKISQLKIDDIKYRNPQ